jgi:hypothetical protein
MRSRRAMVYMRKVSHLWLFRTPGLVIFWNMKPLAGMLLHRLMPGAQMANEPKDQDDQRPLDQAAQLARDVMRRMLAMPPKPQKSLKEKHLRAKRNAKPTTE